MSAQQVGVGPSKGDRTDCVSGPQKTESVKKDNAISSNFPKDIVREDGDGNEFEARGPSVSGLSTGGGSTKSTKGVKGTKGGKW